MQQEIRDQDRPAKAEFPTHSRLLAKRISCRITSFPSAFTAPLKHHSGKVKARSDKACIVPGVFLARGVDFARLLLVEVRRRQGANNRNINSQAASIAPELERNVSGPPLAFIRRAQQAELLHLGAQQAKLSKLENPVADSIVPRDCVLSLLAAQGVIAKNIHGLLAERTRDRIRENRETEEARDSGNENFGSHDGVPAGGRRGQRGDPCLQSSRRRRCLSRSSA